MKAQDTRRQRSWQGVTVGIQSVLANKFMLCVLDLLLVIWASSLVTWGDSGRLWRQDQVGRYRFLGWALAYGIPGHFLLLPLFLVNFSSLLHRALHTVTDKVLCG